MKKSALIFGYNDYSAQIAKNISYKYEEISVFKLDSDEPRSDLDEFSVEMFDFSDEWTDLAETHDIENSVAFCVLEDDAENIFLTISLRAAFEDLTIIALSKNKESANKLSMAGANKVIPLVQTTATMISDILEKPVVTEVLHSILYEQSDLKVSQIEIKNSSCFKNKFPYEIEWSREHGIIVLSVLHVDGSSEFIFSSKAKHHEIKEGDVFVVVGYETDIEAFEKLIGGDTCGLE
ncbi:MAG: NAD-binding protein [Campylobacterota bacterium]|nr:NAD-binding protein [Campylobacterota bacterium]